MKFPKHRANVFLVVRQDMTEREELLNVSFIGVFPTPEGADAFKGACEQEWMEKYGHPEESFSEFSVQLSTYYDE